MQVGIPGVGTREMFMSAWIVLLCLAGAIGNYIFHKLTGKGWGTATWAGFIRAFVLGGIAGVILIGLTEGGEGIGHFDIIFIALPFGAISELVVGKYLGWKENGGGVRAALKKRTEAKPAAKPKTDPTDDKPAEKKGEPHLEQVDEPKEPEK